MRKVASSSFTYSLRINMIRPIQPATSTTATTARLVSGSRIGPTISTIAVPAAPPARGLMTPSMKVFARPRVTDGTGVYSTCIVASVML